MMTHTGEKPYKYSQCDKVFFLHKLDQELHLRIQAREDSYNDINALKYFKSILLKNTVILSITWGNIQGRCHTNAAMMEKLSHKNIILKYI